jgi:hypothetical protein
MGLTGRTLQSLNPHAGIVKLSCCLPDFGDEQQSESLPQTPVSSPDHQSRGLAVSQILTELPRCGGTPGEAGHYRDLRNRQAVL